MVFTQSLGRALDADSWSLTCIEPLLHDACDAAPNLSVSHAFGWLPLGSQRVRGTDKLHCL